MKHLWGFMDKTQKQMRWGLMGAALMLALGVGCESSQHLKRNIGIVIKIDDPGASGGDEFRCLQREGEECVSFEYGSFDIDLNETTQSEWIQTLSYPVVQNGVVVHPQVNNPSFNQGEVCMEDGVNNCPVERVNYYEVLYYANKLSEKYGLDSCYDLSSCHNEASIGSGCPGDGDTPESKETSCTPCVVNQETGIANCPNTEYICGVELDRDGPEIEYLLQIPEAVPGCNGYQLLNWYEAVNQMMQYNVPSQGSPGRRRFTDRLEEPNGWCALPMDIDENEFRIGTTKPVGSFYMSNLLREYQAQPFKDASGNVSEWNARVPSQVNNEELDLRVHRFGANITINPNDIENTYFTNIRERLDVSTCHAYVQHAELMPTEKSYTIGFRLARKILCRFDVPFSEFEPNRYDNEPYLREHCQIVERVEPDAE